FKYIIHWRWFVLGVFVSLVLAFIYLRYAENKYQSQTTVLIKDDKSQGNQLLAFSELDIFSGTKVLDNEIEVLKSRTLSEIAVDSLNLNVSYYSEGNITKTEIYRNVPIKVIDIKGTEVEKFTPQYYSIKFTDKGYQIKSDESGDLGEYQFGQEVRSDSISFSIVRNTNTLKTTEELQEDGTIGIQIASQKQTVESLRHNLSIEPTSKNASVLRLSVSLPSSEKGAL